MMLFPRRHSLFPSQRADWPEHKRICEEATEKPVRVLNVGQEAVRAGMIKLQAAVNPKQRACAYCHLGKAYHDLSDYRKAIEFHERYLALALEAGDHVSEDVACSESLGIAYTAAARSPRAGWRAPQRGCLEGARESRGRKKEA
jgi:hypothetical protein